MKLNTVKLLNYSTITKEQLDKEIEKGILDIREGRVYSAEEIEAEIKQYSE